MASLGNIFRVDVGIYADRTTGNILTVDEASPIIETARYNGYLAQGARGNFVKARDTLISINGLEPGQADEAIARFRAAYQSWKDSGYAGDEPTLDSP